MGLTFHDAVLTMKVDTAWSGGAVPGFGTDTVIDLTIKARTLRVEDNLEMVDVRGAGADRKEKRPTVKEGKLTLSNVIAVGGYDLKLAGDADTNSPVGKWVQISHKPISSLASADVWTGIISKWTLNQNMDQPSLEECEIDLQPDHT